MSDAITGGGGGIEVDGVQSHTADAVSAGIRRVGGQVRAEHHTVGVVRTLPGDLHQLDCACGVTLTNGPGWSLDEHLRLHRAEVKYEALVAVAHPRMPLARTAGRSPAARAVDALLAGDTRAARWALAALDDHARAQLRTVAHRLVRLLDVADGHGTGAADDAHPAEARPAG